MISSRGSKHLGMKRPSRRFLGNRSSAGRPQPPAPKLPERPADPAGLRPQHYLPQLIPAVGALEAANVVPGADAHHLRNDAILRRRVLVAPPDVAGREVAKEMAMRGHEMRSLLSQFCSYTFAREKRSKDPGQ